MLAQTVNKRRCLYVDRELFGRPQWLIQPSSTGSKRGQLVKDMHSASVMATFDGSRDGSCVRQKATQKQSSKLVNDWLVSAACERPKAIAFSSPVGVIPPLYSDTISKLGQTLP